MILCCSSADSEFVWKHLSSVMAGLVPAIHVLLGRLLKEGVDARDKRGHDDEHVDAATKSVARRWLTID
jgi:hypothetical protein